MTQDSTEYEEEENKDDQDDKDENKDPEYEDEYADGGQNVAHQYEYIARTSCHFVAVRRE
jgi:hypothetical protein